MDIKTITPQLIGLKVKHAVAPIVRHHVIISFVVVMGALIFAIFTVNQILTQPTDQTYLLEQQTEGVRTRFDEATITQIDNLRRSDDATALTLPSGRINPFAE